MITGHRIYPYDTNCDLIGDVVWKDSSFDHGLGVERRYSYDVKNFEVRVWIDGVDELVTTSLSKKRLEHYKQRFLNWIYQLDREIKTG